MAQLDPVVISQVEELVRALIVAAKATVFYPPASLTPLETAKGPAKLLHELLGQYAVLSLKVGPGGYLYLDGVPLPERGAYAKFAEDLYNRHVTEVRFRAGVEPRDIVLFLNGLRYSPEELEASGGWEGHLWEQGVTAITLEVDQAYVADLPPAVAAKNVIQPMAVSPGFEDSQPAKALEFLEWTLPRFAESGDWGLLAKAASAMAAADAQPDVSAEQKMALRLGNNRLASAIDLPQFVSALRPRHPGDEKWEGANSLLHAFGSTLVRLLLDALANETDMARRKTLVDILSEISVEQCAQLVVYLDDSRWYVVRNVVSVLSSIRSPESIEYLDKVLRHPEPRVRREVIRALSRISDPRAHDRLIRSLQDQDGQNVQLAARYLGLAKVRGSIPALEQVARGEGLGCRDTGPRVEAIESLARMHATESIPALESICKVPLLKRSKNKEIATAAKAACQLLQREAR